MMIDLFQFVRHYINWSIANLFSFLMVSMDKDERMLVTFLEWRKDKTLLSRKAPYIVQLLRLTPHMMIL